MHCPVCNAEDTKVVDSRLVQEGSKVRRRRECLNPACGARFTTYETAEITMPMIVKQSGVREEFSLTKLRGGLMRAVEKRPIKVDDINQLIHTVEQQLLSCGEREVHSRQIGEWVMMQLKSLDHVAYIRFASVYLSFQDVEGFINTIAELKRS